MNDREIYINSLLENDITEILYLNYKLFSPLKTLSKIEFINSFNFLLEIKRVTGENPSRIAEECVAISKDILNNHFNIKLLIYKNGQTIIIRE